VSNLKVLATDSKGLKINMTDNTATPAASLEVDVAADGSVTSQPANVSNLKFTCNDQSPSTPDKCADSNVTFTDSQQRPISAHITYVQGAGVDEITSLPNSTSPDSVLPNYGKADYRKIDILVGGSPVASGATAFIIANGVTPKVPDDILDSPDMNVHIVVFGIPKTDGNGAAVTPIGITKDASGKPAHRSNPLTTPVMAKDSILYSVGLSDSSGKAAKGLFLKINFPSATPPDSGGDNGSSNGSGGGAAGSGTPPASGASGASGGSSGSTPPAAPAGNGGSPGGSTSSSNSGAPAPASRQAGAHQAPRASVPSSPGSPASNSANNTPSTPPTPPAPPVANNMAQGDGGSGSSASGSQQPPAPDVASGSASAATHSASRSQFPALDPNYLTDVSDFAPSVPGSTANFNQIIGNPVAE
jgi:hypothetical protein